MSADEQTVVLLTEIRDALTRIEALFVPMSKPKPPMSHDAYAAPFYRPSASMPPPTGGRRPT